MKIIVIDDDGNEHQFDDTFVANTIDTASLYAVKSLLAIVSAVITLNHTLCVIECYRRETQS